MQIGIYSLALFISACSTIDCTLNSRVLSVYAFEDTLSDAITVSTTRYSEGDTVLLNKLVNATSFSIPMSYTNGTDILYIERTNTTGHRTLDTLQVAKINVPYIESIECNPTYIHTLTNVAYTQYGIDSVRIENPTVSFDKTHAHIKIYFKTHI